MPIAGGRLGPIQYPTHPSGRNRFSSLPAQYAGMARAGGAVTTYEVIGAEVLFTHFLAASAILDQTAPQIMDVVGDLGVEEARSLVPYDTGATHDSITIVGGSSQQLGMGFGFRTAGSSQYFVEVGPETFYAPFLEYGTMFMEPRPFMLPALDIMALALTASVKAIIFAVVEGEGGGGGLGGSQHASKVLSDPRVRNPFSGLRSLLYSSSKALGDISVIGGRGLFGPLRASMYGLARGLGDVGSTMNQTLGTRVTNRLRGRATGRIIGYGSASLSFGTSYSAFPGGDAGHRVYQRFVGSNTRLSGIEAYGTSSLVNRFFAGG